MPNIIEQQDLLKGLPDDRLATLMQNPTGDIPPFLVAAEAQRRQSIRAQFSGGPEESVVDTLTKQMANVPQNIQAPAQQPPQMPPPQQGGVADLQQGMRDGGMVQRYQDGSLVTPAFRGRAGGGGYYPGEQPQGDFVTDVYNYVTGVSAPYFDRLRRFGINPTPEQIKTIQEESAAGSESEPYRYGMTADERMMMQKAPVLTAAPAEQPRDPNAGQTGTSYENKMSAREAELRKRQEELFGDTELSSWEKAQKWFAAAQAAVQPGQTNAQAAINALAALGGGFAEEKAAQRQSESEKEKAMLQWDLARYEADRAAAAKAAEDRKDERIGAYKFYAEQAGGSLKEAGDMLDSLERRRAEYIKNLPETLPGAPPPDYSKDPYIASLDKRIQQVQDMITGAQGAKQRALSGYGSATGTDPSVTVFTGEGLATYNRQ